MRRCCPGGVARACQVAVSTLPPGGALLVCHCRSPVWFAHPVRHPCPATRRRRMRSRRARHWHCRRWRSSGSARSQTPLMLKRLRQLRQRQQQQQSRRGSSMRRRRRRRHASRSGQQGGAHWRLRPAAAWAQRRRRMACGRCRRRPAWSCCTQVGCLLGLASPTQPGSNASRPNLHACRAPLACRPPPPADLSGSCAPKYARVLAQSRLGRRVLRR